MTRTIAVLLLALAASPLVAQPTPPPGRLCIGAPGSDLLAGNCRDVTAEELEVAPEGKTRSWAHLDGARKQLTLGTLPPDATKIALARKPGALLSLAGAASRDWPASATLTVASKESRWSVTLPAKEATTLRAIAVDDGTYDLGIAAAHHFPFERKATKFSAAAPALLGNVTLKPLPRLRVSFADKEGSPLADVRITTPDGKLLAISNATGEVAEELREQLPERLFARRDGFGHRTFELSNPVDVNLGRVVLTSGATLTIDVERKDYAGPLTVSLIRTHEHARGQRTTFASQQLDGKSSRFVLNDLEARDYILILRGEEPLQTIMKPLSLGDAEKKSISIALDSYRVRGTVHRGGDAYREGPVGFTAGNGEWFSETKTDAQGRFASEAWQKGRVAVVIEPPGASGYRAIREISAPLNEWDIELPDRKIAGVVVDKATGKPLPNAVVSLNFRIHGPQAMGGSRAIPLRPDATFELDMLEPGSFDFEARLEPYLSKAERVELTAADRERRVRLELEEGTKVRVQLHDAAGRPPLGAEIFAVRTDFRRMGGRWQVDPNGLATIALHPEETKTLWALTLQDSFAQFTLRAADAGARPVSVSLPPPVATIVVRTVREDGTPVPGVHIFMSHNGVFLDNDVRGYFAARRGTPMRTGSDGTITLPHMPAGTYELWGIETPSMNVASNGRPQGNVARLTALPGPNEVKLVMQEPSAKK